MTCVHRIPEKSFNILHFGDKVAIRSKKFCISPELSAFQEDPVVCRTAKLKRRLMLPGLLDAPVPIKEQKTAAFIMAWEAR